MTGFRASVNAIGFAATACLAVLFAATARAEENAVLHCVWTDGETDTFTLDFGAKSVQTSHTHPNPGGSPSVLTSTLSGTMTQITDQTISFNLGPYLQYSLNRYTLEITASGSGWVAQCQKEQKQL